MVLSDLDLLHWLTRWGHTSRLELNMGEGVAKPIEFFGQVAELTPHLENGDKELSFTHRVSVPGGQAYKLAHARFFMGRPALALVGHTFYLLRNALRPGCLSIGPMSQPFRCAS